MLEIRTGVYGQGVPYIISPWSNASPVQALEKLRAKLQTLAKLLNDVPVNRRLVGISANGSHQDDTPHSYTHRNVIATKERRKSSL